MLLGIDIGNTNINYVLFDEGSIVYRSSIPTKNYNLKKFKNIKASKIEAVIICSVVPSILIKLKRDLRKILKGKIYVVGKDIKVPIKNLYRKPEQVGQDRLINAYAGVQFYGAPCIIVDLGTAITFDIVSKNKAYLGGFILPGLNLSLKALARDTALLPKLKLNRPKEFIGRDTANSILGGLVYGFGILVDGLIERIKKKIGIEAKVILTGGDAKFLFPYCKNIDILDPELIIKGLNLCYEQILKK